MFFHIEALAMRIMKENKNISRRCNCLQAISKIVGPIAVSLLPQILPGHQHQTQNYKSVFSTNLVGIFQLPVSRSNSSEFLRGKYGVNGGVQVSRTLKVTSRSWTSSTKEEEEEKENVLYTHMGITD